MTTETRRNSSHRVVDGNGLYGEQILTEQVRQLYVLAPVGFVATVVNSVIVFFIMREVVEARLINSWLAAVATVLLLRIGLVTWFWSTPLRPETAVTWKNRFVLSLAAIGLVWGSIGVYPMAEMSLAHQVFLAFVLGGMAAGASSTFAMVRSAYPMFAIPALVPIAVQFFLIPDNFHRAMGAMVCLFGLLLWRIAKHNYAVNRTSLLLRFENREMIESLRRAKEDVEELNARLMAEIESKLKAEAELRAGHEHLERVVAERTADLLAANEQLTTAKDSAEAATMAKSEFLANMSHEMRTPLAGTLGMIRLVLEMEIGKEERQLLEMADRSAESLVRIIGDVLDFSRLEAGMMTFEQESFSIPEVIRSAVEVVSLTAREKGLDLSWKVEGSVPQQVHGDEGRLRQVLVNLIGNAVKFTEKGRIEVFVRRLDDAEPPGSGFVLFSVRDTGVGIPTDQMEMIFGKFTQVDSSITRRYGGTGLGLALTRQIVEKLGGTIWAESSIGAGSTFHFTFPLK
ncbi:MAG TPA: ATP-binding protein [Geobacteraceae bacterium]|nr:ATP-binding protein [Geobacteraceae bacterium]